MLMLIVQAQTFYDELGAIVKQLSKMETYLTTTKQVGLLPETLRVQQKQFMVGQWCLYLTLTVYLPRLLRLTLERDSSSLTRSRQGP